MNLESIRTSGIGRVVFGLPSKQRLFLILFYGPFIIGFFFILITLFLISEWEIQKLIMIGSSFALLVIGLSMMPYYFDKKEKMRIKLFEENNKSRSIEIKETLQGTSGNLKSLLVELITYAGGDAIRAIDTHTNLFLYYTYARGKLDYLNGKNTLSKLLSKDIIENGVGANEVQDIYESLVEYSRLLDDLTDKYVKIMPANTQEFFEMRESQFYQKVIFEENTWLEQEALSMQGILDLWIQNHTKEIQQNKMELEKLLSLQKITLGNIITTTSNMKNEMFSRIQVNV